jgi:NIMA (never in mitosis gene a)-related kinase
LGCIFYEIATLNHAFDAQNMKGLVQKILKGTYPPLPEVYSSDFKKLLSEMLIKDPAKRPSIKKILEMPFMKSKIHELFSSTVKIHELNLGRESTMGASHASSGKPEFARLEQSRP